MALATNIAYFKDQCDVASLDPDPDIAGPGVFWSFIILAWVTMILAILKAVFGYLESNDTMLWTNVPLKTSELCAKYKKACNDCILPLCDLQSFTGVAIVGTWIRLQDTISFYHLEYVVLYWWLTINSFWAADFQRDRADDRKTYMDQVRQLLRGFLVLVCVSLGIYCQIYAYSYFESEEGWNYKNKKRCFLYINPWLYPWDTLFWVLGLVFYALALLLSIIPGTSWMLDLLEDGLTHWKEALWTAFISRWDQLRGKYMPPPISDRKSEVLVTLLSGFIAIIAWVTVELLSLWAWSAGNYVVHILAFVYFSISNTRDLMQHRHLNARLVGSGEQEMGFGQIYPIIMTVSVVYSLILSVELPEQRRQQSVRHGQQRRHSKLHSRTLPVLAAVRFATGTRHSHRGTGYGQVPMSPPAASAGGVSSRQPPRAASLGNIV